MLSLRGLWTLREGSSFWVMIGKTLIRALALMAVFAFATVGSVEASASCPGDEDGPSEPTTFCPGDEDTPSGPTSFCPGDEDGPSEPTS